jgi:hypothetical protein
MRENLQAAETFMRLVLKTQTQCRATVETLANIKNPRPVAFVQQANIAHGPQQVNNDSPARELPLAAESQSAQRELLETLYGERLNAGAAGATGRVDTAMETVGAVHGAEDGGRVRRGRRAIATQAPFGGRSAFWRGYFGTVRETEAGERPPWARRRRFDGLPCADSSIGGFETFSVM